MHRACEELRIFNILRGWSIFLKLLQRRKRADKVIQTKLNFIEQIKNGYHHCGFSPEALIYQTGTSFEGRHSELGLL